MTNSLVERLRTRTVRDPGAARRQRPPCAHRRGTCRSSDGPRLGRQLHSPTAGRRAPSPRTGSCASSASPRTPGRCPSQRAVDPLRTSIAAGDHEFWQCDIAVTDPSVVESDAPHRPPPDHRRPSLALAPVHHGGQFVTWTGRSPCACSAGRDVRTPRGHRGRSIDPARKARGSHKSAAPTGGAVRMWPRRRMRDCMEDTDVGLQGAAQRRLLHRASPSRRMNT